MIDKPIQQALSSTEPVQELRNWALRLLAEGQPLPEDTIYQLRLLAHLGSGFVRLDELPAAYEELKSSPANWAWAVSALLDRATLAGDLSDGLEELKQRGISVDKLPLKRSKSRK